VPVCKYCGKWSGLFDDEHQDCAAAVAKGLPVPSDVEPAPPRPVTPTSIFWSVFLALLAFGLLAAVLAFLLRASS
jgi:hypothetical protein